MSPLAPWQKRDLKDVLWRAPWWKMDRRPQELSPSNLRREAPDQKPGPAQGGDRRDSKMIERGRISSGQMALILFAGISTTGTLVSPNMTGWYAGRDLWLSVLWASLYGFVAVGLAFRLHRIYPGENIIQLQPPYPRVPFREKHWASFFWFFPIWFWWESPCGKCTRNFQRISYRKRR